MLLDLRVSVEQMHRHLDMYKRLGLLAIGIWILRVFTLAESVHKLKGKKKLFAAYDLLVEDTVHNFAKSLKLSSLGRLSRVPAKSRSSTPFAAQF